MSPSTVPRPDKNKYPGISKWSVGSGHARVMLSRSRVNLWQRLNIRLGKFWIIMELTKKPGNLYLNISGLTRREIWYVNLHIAIGGGMV